MRSIAALLAACGVLSCAMAQTPPKPGIGHSRGEAYVDEGLGGFGALLLDAACGGAVAFAAGNSSSVMGDPWAGQLVMAVPALVFGLALPACAGLAVSTVGRALHESGSTGGAYAGAYLALPVAAGFGVLGATTHGTGAIVTAVAVATLAIPIGTVIGYNLNSRRGAGLHGNRRVRLPVVMLDRVERGDHVAEYGVKVQLASLGF